MAEDQTFPTDMPDDPALAGNALAWAFQVIILAAVLLTLFNAEALEGWANNLTPTPAIGRGVMAIDAWREETDSFALSTPRRQLNSLWKKAEAAGRPAEGGQR